jgi:5-methylcytosine-specific restriction enzyme subunit McrC
MHHHTTFEHDPFTTFTPTNHHLQLLDRLNKQSKTKLLDIDHAHGHPRLVATHHVGLLHLADLSLQVLPKMHRSPNSDRKTQHAEATRNLLVLLSYALNLPLHDHHAATQTHQPHDWLDLLTRLFAADLLHQLHHAPHRAYTTCDDDLPLLRGKLRIADQLRRPDRHHRFACTFDEFSLDNPLNRVFRFVIHRLLPLTTSSTTRQTLTTLRDLLDDVSLPAHLTPADADPARLLTRLNRRYLPALTLARLFLSMPEQFVNGEAH